MWHDFKWKRDLMRKIFTSLLMLTGLIIGTVAAISAIQIDHAHVDGATVDHAAPLDGNGCHPGPGGYHCH